MHCQKSTEPSTSERQTEPEAGAPWLEDVPPEEMRRVVDALYRVHRLVAVMTNLDALLERIVEESKAVAGAEAASLMLYEPGSEELYFHVALGESGDQQALKKGIRLKLGEGIAGAAAARRETVNVPDAQNDPRFFRGADERSNFETRSLLAVPMLDRDDLIGVLEVVNKTGAASFCEKDARLMEIYSGLAAAAISNARLIEANIRAARLAATGQAVAGLSHYTKNILSGMKTSAELLDEGIRKESFDLIKTAWPIFQRATLRLSGCVEDMLAYSKSRSPRYAECDINALLDEAVDAFDSIARHKNAVLDVRTDGVRRTFQADADGLYRCLLNLLGNAADAIPQRDGRVRITARTLEDGVEIEVADNGPGLTDEAAELAFEPFYSTKGAQGTGLGLAVTKKIVEEHGGELSVSRAPEGGALFRMRLPLG